MEKQTILEATIREGGADCPEASITYKLLANPDASYDLMAIERWNGRIYEGRVGNLDLSREEAFGLIFRFCTDEVSALHVRDVLEEYQ